MIWRIWLRKPSGITHKYVIASDRDHALKKLPKGQRPYVSRIEQAGSAAYRGYDDAA